MESHNCETIDNKLPSHGMKQFAEEFAKNTIIKCDEHLASTEQKRREDYANSMAQNLLQMTIENWAGRRILIVGVVALDIITVVEEYPDEDSEIMAVDHYFSRGGNAGNCATVLGHIGANVEFFGTMVKNRDFDFIQNDFKENNVKTENIVVLDPARHTMPVACVWVSQKTKTRTIVFANFKKVTELTYKDFERLDLSKYKWIHFEGRENVSDIVRMIETIDEFNKNKQTSDKIEVSVEIELPHTVFPQLHELFDKADYVFVSKDYCQSEGYSSKEEAVKSLLQRCKRDATVICPWGEEGAAASKNETVVSSPAFPPTEVTDTVGAGDTFMAATMFSLCAGKSIDLAIRFGCQVAGAKCGMRGFSGLKGAQKMLT